VRTFRPWIVAGLLRPVFLGVAIAAAVIAGDESGSFSFALLAFLVALSCGKVVRRLVRSRWVDAAVAAVWPAAAVGFTALFVEVGLPKWASVLLAIVLAGIARNAVRVRRSRDRWLRLEEWGMPERGAVIEGRARRVDFPG
jgi:hypothetical protein